MVLKRQRGLMVAIDTSEKKEYDRLKSILPSISELGEGIVFKLGLPTVLRFGFQKATNLLKHYDNEIVFDAKLAEDGREKANQILDLCRENDLDGIITHGTSQYIIKNLVRNSGDIDVIAIARMSSETLFNRYYKEIARDAVNCGAKGVVVSANQPRCIKTVRGIVDGIRDTYICSPGIEYQGGDLETALKSGTDYPIVGRAIWKAEDPRETAMKYLKSLSSVKRFGN